MILPADVREKIDKLLSSQNVTELKTVQKELTQRYKLKSGFGESLIESKNDSLIYSVSRMPATFSVIYTLLCQLKGQGLIGDIKTAIDIGSGTGAGYFALREFDENIESFLFERDKNMIDNFNFIEPKKNVQKFDLAKDDINKKADLVLISYVLSELSSEQRKLAVKKLLDSSEKYLLIIDTGTPKVWNEMMQLRLEIENLGGKVIAPCMSKVCPLKNDYCQFYARVERSSLHKKVKDAKLSFEDEKYFYLLISKNYIAQNSKSRVIRRPMHKTNQTSLVLCSLDGVSEKIYTKRNKEEFRLAKKSKINDLI